MCLLNSLLEVASDMDDECREHALPPPALLTINIYAYPEHPSRDASLSGPGEAAADREHVAYCFR